MVSRAKFDRFAETPVALCPVTEELLAEAEKYRLTLNKLLEPLQVTANLFGSMALGIPGKNEFEFKVYANDQNWEQLRAMLGNRYGLPVKVKHDRIRFEENHREQEVEILLVRGDEVAKDQWEMAMLAETKWRTAYVGVKEKFAYSEREYLYQKALFFEGLLRQRIVPSSRLTQRSDYSFGIIPVRFSTAGAPEYLLIRHQIGHWGFPKGHAEGEETALQAAKRELGEETGLRVSEVLSDAPIVENYTYEWEKEIFNKEVQYWLAAVSGDVVLQEAEVKECAWLLYGQAMKTLNFTETKQTLSMAHDAVEKTDHHSKRLTREVRV